MYVRMYAQSSPVSDQIANSFTLHLPFDTASTLTFATLPSSKQHGKWHFPPISNTERRLEQKHIFASLFHLMFNVHHESERREKRKKKDLFHHTWIMNSPLPARPPRPTPADVISVLITPVSGKSRVGKWKKAVGC